jgi:Xaa-Pro aminopeptidase
MDYEGRQARLRRLLEQEGLDGLYLTSLPNLRYLCGFTGSNGSLLIAPERTRFLTDSRYRTRSKEEVEAAEIEVYGFREELEAAVPKAVQELGLDRVGFEAANVSVAQLEKMSEWFKGFDLRPTEGLVERLRRIKDPQELELIKTAAAITDEGFSFILDHVEVGKSERQIALDLEFYLRRMGADDVSFDPIVAAGERSAMPHARPGDQKIAKGSFLLFDFGCSYMGYCSDFTRTVLVGPADDWHREIYELVAQAQKSGLSAVAAGKAAAEVDKAARDVVDAAGLSEAFGHGLGHGVGLEIHEAPTIRKASIDILEAGNVVTIEPGAYFEGRGGVRIEDLVLVTENGADVLSLASKELILL